MEREIVAEYELNEIDDTLHGSVGSRLSLFARELKWRSSSWHGSSALRLPMNCYGGSFVIDPNGR
jgi:transposase-like protein